MKMMHLQLTHSTTVSSAYQPPNATASAAAATTLLLRKSLLPGFPTCFRSFGLVDFSHRKRELSVGVVQASLIEKPVLWVGRICIFYALLKAGLAGSASNPIISELQGFDAGDSVTGGSDGDADMGFSKWLEKFKKNPDKEAADKRKLVSKWHPTTKGTLRRNYRVPSKSEGRRLLKSIASLLSEDDHFVDATSHKGCQIRRESAHGESVCCNNVRALFDELPTPHLLVEITPFPAGPLTEIDYAKAEKLERVLRSSPSI